MLEVPVLKRSHSVAILALSVAWCAALGQVSMSVDFNKPDKPITGLPFTADQRIRTVQHLANGITVTHEMTGRIYRSSTDLERRWSQRTRLVSRLSRWPRSSTEANTR